MRYWTLSVLGVGLYLGSVATFNLKLIELLEAGTCASGNQPFVISQPCPEGTEIDALLLVASIFGLFISGGIFLARGAPPSGWRPRSFAWPLAWWGIFFSVTGAVALIGSLTADSIEADGQLGGIIVGIMFLIMGLPALVFMAMGMGGRFSKAKDHWLVAQLADTKSAASEPTTPRPQRGWASDRPSGDAIDKLERLQRLRESGTLTDAEFEDQKARILAER